AARALPSPLSLRLVTALTLPPRPPVVHMPPPQAPGHAGTTSSGNRGGCGGICPRSGSPATAPCCAYPSTTVENSTISSKCFIDLREDIFMLIWFSFYVFQT